MPSQSVIVDPVAYPARNSAYPGLTGASRKGKPNKDHATVRWGLTEAYRRLGGVEGLVAWGRENPTEFYRLLGRLIPAELAVQLKADVTNPAEKTVIIVQAPPATPPRPPGEVNPYYVTKQRSSSAKFVVTAPTCFENGEVVDVESDPSDYEDSLSTPQNPAPRPRRKRRDPNQTHSTSLPSHATEAEGPGVSPQNLKESLQEKSSGPIHGGHQREKPQKFLRRFPVGIANPDNDDLYCDEGG
ncbi:MAG: hypothetical protein KGL39_34265 [Patescibacteria group bacterium]|nr:hypothetical protein [Patescibacteria group bacterium]